MANIDFRFSIPLVLLGLLLSSCAKDPMPEDDVEDVVRFSVLGDSYSTFEGYVDPETNDVWSYYDTIGVTDVEQMWWYQLGQTLDWVMEKNNSFSGSLVSNVNVGGYYGQYSFLHRMDDLGDPDYILIFGGTNDMWNDVPMGNYIYSGWTEGDLNTFRPALAKLFHGLQHRYPDAQLVFMADSDLGEEFMESVHKVTDHYGVWCADLVNIDKKWMHPSAEGMSTIASQTAGIIRWYLERNPLI